MGGGDEWAIERGGGGLKGNMRERKRRQGLKATKGKRREDHTNLRTYVK